MCTRKSWGRHAAIVKRGERKTGFRVGVGSSLCKLRNSRLVGWVESDVARQVLFHQEVCAMPRGKEDFARNEGARAQGDGLPFELPGWGHAH